MGLERKGWTQSMFRSWKGQGWEGWKVENEGNKGIQDEAWVSPLHTWIGSRETIRRKVS